MKENAEIAILDFGSQYTHLIARRVRELGTVSHIYPNDIAAVKLKNAVGIILSGGPKSVRDINQPDYDPKLFALGVPVLGICYGHQLIADFFGGKIATGKAREYGLATIKLKPSPLFQNIKTPTTVWMSHGDHVTQLPAGFKSIAATTDDPLTALANENKKIYGLQFHPEVTHTKQGKRIFNNFIFTICRANKNWTANQMLEQIQTHIKKQAGDKNIFLLISGGVDSTVCFALLAKALGKNRVYALHIDHGLMRLNESSGVNRALKKIGLTNLHIHDASREFFRALKTVINPEQKRKIIGNLFLDIADKVMKEKKMTADKWLLGQGTIYPDTIESGGTKQADLIKTHHNRVPRIQQMIAAGQIIEPTKELYKDEVRQIGLKLGLPQNLLNRHPFPGPGLAIRCLCSTGDDKTKAQLMVVKQFPDLKIYRLPIKSVGVQGDERSYAHPALIIWNKQLTSRTWSKLGQIAPIITNRDRTVNRVLVLLSGDQKKITRSELKRATLTKPRLNLLRQIDAIVNKNVSADPSCARVWQLPVVLIPFGYNKKEAVILRPVESTEAMTVNWTRLPAKTLNKIVKKINQLKQVDYIFYDLTNKPPGTIEWE